MERLPSPTFPASAARFWRRSSASSRPETGRHTRGRAAEPGYAHSDRSRARDER
jgi:hypothetical protein